MQFCGSSVGRDLQHLLTTRVVEGVAFRHNADMFHLHIEGGIGIDGGSGEGSAFAETLRTSRIGIPAIDVIVTLVSGGSEGSGATTSHLGIARYQRSRHRRVDGEGGSCGARVVATIAVLTGHIVGIRAEGFTILSRESIRNQVLTPVGGDTADGPAVFHIAAADSGGIGSERNLIIRLADVHRGNFASGGSSQFVHGNSSISGTSVVVGTRHAIGASTHGDVSGMFAGVPEIIIGTRSGEGNIAIRTNHRVFGSNFHGGGHSHRIIQNSGACMILIAHCDGISCSLVGDNGDGVLC